MNEQQAMHFNIALKRAENMEAKLAEEKLHTKELQKQIVLLRQAAEQQTIEAMDVAEQSEQEALNEIKAIEQRLKNLEIENAKKVSKLEKNIEKLQKTNEEQQAVIKFERNKNKELSKALHVKEAILLKHNEKKEKSELSKKLQAKEEAILLKHNEQELLKGTAKENRALKTQLDAAQKKEKSELSKKLQTKEKEEAILLKRNEKLQEALKEMAANNRALKIQLSEAQEKEEFLYDMAMSNSRRKIPSKRDTDNI
jgi:hypothetical protein